MRRVGEAEAHKLISWLDQPPWTSEIGTGYDREGWADSIWVLHAMFERDRVPDVTYEEIRRRAIDEGAKDPMAAWNENTPEEVIAAMRKASGGVIVLTADGLVDTGIPLGFVKTPEPPWRRLRWAALAARQSFTLGAEAAGPPSYRWFPQSSFPVHILPPPEGSLDELTLRAFFRVLGEYSKPDAARNCVAFYGSAATRDSDIDVFTGALHNVAELVTGEQDMRSTPSNLWPTDKSWFVYTDWDLMATKVSGPAELVAAIEADDELESLRWEPSIDTYLFQHNIAVTPAHKGDPGSPTIALPIPLGWMDAGANTPDGVYSVLVYAGAEVAEYRPNIAAMVSKLTGELDPQEIIDLAPGQLKKLARYEPLNGDARSTLCGYPAYQQDGTCLEDGRTWFYTQKLVVIPTPEGAYLLQLCAYGLLTHRDVISAGAGVVYAQTTITA